jgi:hypothetical protein
MRTSGSIPFLAAAIVLWSVPPAAASGLPGGVALQRLMVPPVELPKWGQPPLPDASEAPRVHLVISKQQLAKVLADGKREPYITLDGAIAKGLSLTAGQAVEAQGVVSVVYVRRRGRQKHMWLRLFRPEGGFRTEAPVGEDYILLIFQNWDDMRNYAFLTTSDLKLRAAIKWKHAADTLEPPGAEAEKLFQAELTYWTETIPKQ